ncbi:MAG TPA: biotin transporter BioY [Kineosporiaceae bacterium]|nr:biotin transporter BioY [Kineosporiaceae bacterium]
MTDFETPSDAAPSGRRMPARDLALIAVFAAFLAALGFPGALTVPGLTVPITAQTLGVMLAGCVLGARRAALAVLTFLVLVAAGLPLLAGGRGGLGVFASPTAGFLVGWVIGAWVIGRMVELWRHRFALGWGILANVVGGIAVIYAIGVPVMAQRSGSTLAKAFAGATVFLPGDLIKAVVAAVVARAVYRGYPLLSRRQERSGTVGASR